MKNTLRKIAMIFVLVLFAGMVTGCTLTVTQEREMGNFFGDIFEGIGELGEAAADLGGAIAAEARAAEYRKTAETVKQYDEVDTF